MPKHTQSQPNVNPDQTDLNPDQNEARSGTEDDEPFMSIWKAPTRGRIALLARRTRDMYDATQKNRMLRMKAR